MTGSLLKTRKSITKERTLNPPEKKKKNSKPTSSSKVLTKIELIRLDMPVNVIPKPYIGAPCLPKILEIIVAKRGK